MIAHKLTDDEEIIAAAALHDVVEDTIYSKDDIEFIFGERIAALVVAESENKREDILPEQSWRIRKEETLAHLERAPKDVKLICLADKLSNIRAIRSDYEKLKDKLWVRFNQSDPVAHAWYYGAIRDVLKDEFGETQAWQEYTKIVEVVFKGI
jgi:myo-inositol-1(or 4)-monophosphatase